MVDEQPADDARGLLTEPVFDYRNDSSIKGHPDYRAAKEGDTEAAARLVRDLVKPESLQASREAGPDVVYVPVHAEEAGGRNKIPVALAMEHASVAGARVGTDIVQNNRAFHTGAGPMERILNRVEFKGKVEPGRRYVLVDDVTTMGSTLTDLAAYIQQNGGKVEGARLLVNAARDGKIVASPKVIKELEARHGQTIREIIGIGTARLSGPESQYLLNFKSADQLRSRAAKARLERVRRLSAKNLLPEREVGAGVSAEPEDTNTPRPAAPSARRQAVVMPTATAEDQEKMGRVICTGNDAERAKAIDALVIKPVGALKNSRQAEPKPPQQPKKRRDFDQGL